MSTDCSQKSIKPILPIPTEFPYSTGIGYFECMPIGIIWGKPMPLASAIQSLACLSCLCLRQTHEQSTALDFVIWIVLGKSVSRIWIRAFSPPSLSWQKEREIQLNEGGFGFINLVVLIALLMRNALLVQLERRHPDLRSHSRNPELLQMRLGIAALNPSCP
ncbi:MAG: hypothetical protein ABJM29_16340 [Rhizobiaceae bacterium]